MYARIEDLKHKLEIFGFLNSPEDVDVSYIKHKRVLVKCLGHSNMNISFINILDIIDGHDHKDIEIHLVYDGVDIVLTRDQTDEEFEACKAEQRQIGYDSWKKLYDRFNDELTSLLAITN